MLQRYAYRVATAFSTGAGEGIEDGLSGSKGGRTLGFEPGCEWKRRSGANGGDEGVSVL